MIKTFIANNGQSLKTGMVESQPTISSEEEESTNILQLQGLQLAPDSDVLKTITNSSLDELKKEFIRPNLILTSLKGNSVNRINSTFELSVENNSFYEKMKDFSSAPKEFSLYESLTGISQEKPEIIMMTDFQPIFISDKPSNEALYVLHPSKPSLTPAGRYFDQQLNIKSLKSHNIKHIINFNQRKSAQFFSRVKERKSALSTSMDEASSIVSFVFNVIKKIDLIKDQLDVRDKIHTVDSRAVFKNFIAGNSQIFSEEALRFLTNLNQQNLVDNFNAADLMKKFNFSQENIENTFTSTKIWLQILLETKEVLKHHSLSLFDIKSLQHESDTNPIKFVKTPGIKRFSLLKLRNDPPPLKELQASNESQLVDLAQKLTFAYQQIYENIHFKNEQIRISALINALSKELKYSNALSSADVKSTLKTYFNYDVAPRGNDSIFDIIIGNFGDNIGDVPSSNSQNKSLASLFQEKSGNSVILPFESRSIEGDLKNLKSGSEFYVEPITKTDGKKFNTQKIKQFSEALSNAEVAFSYVANKLNFMSLTYEDESAFNNSQNISATENPKILFDTFLSGLIESGKPTSLLKDDVATAVFHLARFDEKIRTLLFLYVISANQAAKSSLEEQLTIAVQDNLKRVSTEKLFNSVKDSVSIWGLAKKIEYAKTLGLQNSKLILKIKEKLFNIPFLKEFNTTQPKNNLNFNLNDRQYTIYSGHTDTAIAMFAFDILISVAYNFGSKSLIGYTSAEEQQMFVIQTDSNVDYSNLINQIYNKINVEVSLVQHSTLLLLNSLANLRETINSTLNFIENKNSNSTLEKLSKILENVDLTNLLFEQQQVELISSQIADLNFALKNVDAGKNEDIKILDEFTIGTNLKKALEDFFLGEEFSSHKSKNQKILSFGVPLGFVKKLKNRVDIKKTKKPYRNDRQDDILKVKLYKIDLKNPDIIFLPKEFLFELSRYPARNDTLIKPFSEGQVKNVNEISSHFATRDYSQIFSPSGAQVQYLQAQKNELEALSSKDYSFLSETNKKQLYLNHVKSYLLECYLKIMTGISTAEHSFSLKNYVSNFEPEFLEYLFNFHINNFISERQIASTEIIGRSSQTKLFSAANRSVGGKKTGGYSNIEALTHYEDFQRKSSINLNTSNVELKKKEKKPFSHQISVLNEVARTLTDISSPDLVLKRILSPRQFDRIFNISFDPYTFKIDVEMTNSTPHGKVALQSLINRGDVILESSAPTMNLGSIKLRQNFSYRERNKSQGELLMEKYFITIENFGAEEN